MSRRFRQTTPESRSWKKRFFAASLIGMLSAGSSMGQQYPNLPPVPTSQNQVSGQNLATSSMRVAVKPSDSQLKVYSVPSDQIGNVSAQLQLQYHTNASVKITTEPRTGQLMVMAPEAIQNQVAGQVAAFMRENKIPVGDRGNNLATNTEQKYALQNLSWRELEDSIQRLAGPRMTVTTERNGELANLRMANPTGLTDILQIDRRLNSVTMLGTNATVAGWAQVVYSLDQGQADRSRLTHIVPLAPAAPRQIQKAIQLVKATVQQEQADNQQTEARVDVGDQPATAIGTIDQLGAESGLFGDVQIEFIEELDLVIIRGNKRDVQRTLDVIEKIKKQAVETQPEVDVFPLQHANGQAVATLVTELYENIYAPRQGPVSITALGQPNALLLIGSKEVVQSVKELISKIDQPLDRDNQLKVIRLLHAASVDVEARVREFFVEQPPGTEQRVGIGTRVKVLADYRTNSLIVQASPREMIELQLLIDQLDVEGTEAENEVRVFRLQNTLSDDLQTVINEVITGEGAGGDTAQATPPSGKLTILTVDGNKIESGILAGVIITSDPSVNALVVRAPAQSMALIEQLIDQLDKLPSAEARIKVFQLMNGDATSLAQTLQSLFGLPVTAGQTAGNNFLTNLTQSTLTAGGEGSLVQLQIAADARTNSIIVSGASSDLEVFETLLLRLDEDVVESRRMEVIWLRNANADEVAAALTSYFQQQTTANQHLANGISQILSQSQLVARQVFVVAEVTTNSILLSASPAYFDMAVKLVERLDRRPPMVAIQVLIAEVQLDDSLEFGAEWGIQDGLLFDRRSASGGTLSSPIFNLGATALTGPSGGVGQTGNVAGQAITNFAVGRSNSDSLGGLVLSASSEAVGVLVRALQTANRLQVLSRPQITTMDQRPASTLVGQQVPRIQGVTQSANIGQTVNAVDTSVVLGLSVLPRVNQDGLIVMQVQVLNSSVGDTDTGIPIGFGVDGQVIRSPIINTIEASTTVSAYSGQTVVFAGLIQKTRASVRRQIPILGSLPIIGAAFRFDTEAEQRRELMVVLTPRIIQTDEDYDVLKQVESSRMSWCLADVLNIHGDVGLSGGNGLWGPAKSSVIFPDLQPTALEDRSVPNSQRPGMDFQPMGEPSIIEGYPQGPQAGTINQPAIPPDTTSAAAAPNGNSPYRTVGYAQPQQTGAVPNQATLNSVQMGAYK